jgi:hypothetical protein
LVVLWQQLLEIVALYRPRGVRHWFVLFDAQTSRD